MSLNEKAWGYIDGIASHWYSDSFAPTSILTDIQRQYPDKFFISTEASSAAQPWVFEKVALGSWKRAEDYARNIIECLNLHMTGWIDWNLALNKAGGPSWLGNSIDSPMIVLPESDEFLKQPTFYAMGHFTKFIPRSSVRIGMEKIRGNIEGVSVLRPDGGVSVVLLNPSNVEKFITVSDGSQSVQLKMARHSIQSLVYW